LLWLSPDRHDSARFVRVRSGLRGLHMGCKRKASLASRLGKSVLIKVDLTGQLSNLPRPLRELIGPVRSWAKASD
jgi:hypothetical protein